MSKRIITALLLTTLLGSSALAQPPLPPGRPAGPAKAQLDSTGTAFVGAGILILGLGLYLASGSTYKIPGDTVVPPATNTTP